MSGPPRRGPRRSAGAVEWHLATPLRLAFLAFFAAPLLLLTWVSFYEDNDLTRIGTRDVGEVPVRPVLCRRHRRTVKLGIATVLAATLLAYPLALVFYSASPGVRRLLLFIVILPLLTSVVVRTFAWIVILSREGVVNHTLMWLGLTAAPCRYCRPSSASSSP